MKTDYCGTRIRLLNTIEKDLDQILEFEKANREFVHNYSLENHMKLLSDDNCLHLSIFTHVDNLLIGHIILFGLVDPDLNLEFRRITINDKCKGYGREAIQLSKKLCFEILQFNKIWLDVYDDNKRAISLYESEGFINEGIQKTGQDNRSQRIYSMTEAEYSNNIL